jgi:hypothetical protein
MAMTYQNFASLGVNLNRQKYGPLDISNVFTSAADLKYYLTKGTFTEGVSEYWYKNANEKIVPYPYEGQVLATVIDGVVNVYALALDAEGNFTTQEIAGKIEVDNKTIKLNADGKLELVGIPADIAGKTLVPSLVNGELTWAEPDTSTAEGQAQEIEGLKTRATALETTVNGKPESAEGANDAVVGLVDKVAANTQAIADEAAAREAAIGKAAEGETAATGVYAAIAEALAEAKKYADDNDANTEYDDTDVKGRLDAIEADYLTSEDAYDDAEVRGLITDLEEAIGNANGGLVKDIADNKQAIADEKARAEAAEKALGERIDGIDFVDADELADAIKDFATTEYVNTELAKKAAADDLTALTNRVDAFLTGTGATDALDSLQELITYINEHDDTDISGILESIQAIENKLAGVDATVVAYVTAAIEALKIGDYAKAADLTALAGRVEALEAKPFDTYATKTEVSDVDAKFAQYTTTETLTTQLAAKADADKVVANDTFETFKTGNTTVISDAKDAAIAAAKLETETQVGALKTEVAKDYATKAELTTHEEEIANDLLAYAKTNDVNAELAKKIETGTIAHTTEETAEGVTVDGTTMNIVVDAFTKAETRQYVADTISQMTGGESAADVLLALNNYKSDNDERVGAIETKNSEQDTAIANAQTQADKGVADAAKVAADLVTANAAIADNAREIGVAKGSIDTVNTTLTAKITELEGKDAGFTTSITALETLTSGHTTTITEQGTKIAALENEDTRLATLIQSNTDKFAGYYTKGEVDAAVQNAIDQIPAVDFTPYAKVTDVEAIYKVVDGTAYGVLADEITRAKAAEEANANAISALVGEDAGKTIRAIATEEAKAEVAALVGEAPEALDTIHEIASWIKDDETGAAAMSAEIAQHSGILAGFGGEGQPSTVVAAIATAKQEAINAIPVLAIATADVLGGVKSSADENKVAVGTDGTMEVNSMNVNKLVQTDGDTLILSGGDAGVKATA